MRKGNARRLFASCILSFFLCRSLTAGLVICVYHNHEMYVGSDSLSLPGAAGDAFRSRSIFKVADTCCVTYSGYYGPTLKSAKTGKESRILFPAELEEICGDVRPAPGPLQGKIDRILALFGERYHEFLDRMKSEGATNGDVGGAAVRIAFMGFDGSKQAFFGASYRFSGTNRTVLETVFERNSTNNLGSLSFQGETRFLGALMSGEKKVAQLPSENFRKTVADIYTEVPIPEQRLTDCMLEIFRLQKSYSASLGYDEGSIEEPYTLCKITTNGIVLVH